MDDVTKEGASPKQPEGMVVYKPEKEMYARLHLCIHLRQLLDNPPSPSEVAEQEKRGHR